MRTWIPVLLLAPALLIAAPATPAKTLAVEVQTVLKEARTAVEKVAQARKAHLEAKKDPKTFQAPLDSEVASFEARLKTEKRPEVRQALLVGRYQLLLLEKKDPTAAFAALVKAEVPSTSPAWALEAGLLPRFLETCFHVPAEAEAFAAPGRASHLDAGVRAGLVMAQFEATLGEDNATALAALERLEKEFPKDKSTTFARRLWEAQARTPVGGAVPAFEIASLEDPKVLFTSETFKGRTVLIDFWATWCPPCRAELPGLHQAYARFKDKGLEVLSLSRDVKAEDIAAYRAKPGLAMPWKHAFLGRDKHPLIEAFGVVGIPKPILVGPDGKILATDAQLRGARLEKTLEKFLGK